MQRKRKKHCIVLLSGGLDSATVLNIALKEYQVTALVFDYGQRHKFEISAAKQIADKYDISLRLIKIDLGQFGNSALTDDIEVPKNQEIGKEIPITYVPVRNTIFLSYALAYAEVNNIFDIFIGVNALDYSGYPDCRPEFIDSIQSTINLGTKVGVDGNSISISAPLINMSKREIILYGIELGIDYSRTVSCYQLDSEGDACGECDSCKFRKEGFRLAGIKDPTRYKN